MNKNQQKKYEQALNKAEIFYNKKNYQSAKRHFDFALRLNPGLIKIDLAIADKINICQHQEALRLRKEDIKKARNYEKKNKFSQALELFEKALSLEKEDWIEDKIAQLKEKLAHSDIADIGPNAQTNFDPKAKLQALQKLLENNQNNIQIKKQMAQCYVKSEQYHEAITLYQDIAQTTHTAKLSDNDAYYLGYAYLQTGELILGLLQWSNISPSHSQAGIIFSQFQQLLPFAIDELNTIPHDQPDKTLILNNFYKYLCLFDPIDKNLSDIENEDIDKLKFLYIEQLWQTHQYDEILPLIQPFPDTITLAQLELYAKLYFRLASKHNNIQYLEYAISFWLSAIYNDKLLQSLASFQQAIDTKNAVDKKNDAVNRIKELQDQLLLKLEQLIDDIEKETKLPEHFKNQWQNERHIIQRMYQFGNKSKTFRKNIETDFFPCTPVFAQKFHLNEIIYPLISSNRRYLMGKHSHLSEDEFYKMRCYYSPLAEFMFQANNGEELSALKSLSKTLSFDFDDKELIDYCQQKIAFQYAYRMLFQSSEKADKYFRQALPLIVKYPEYANKLSTLALLDRTPLKVYVQLPGIMEILSKQIKTAKFLEATAYSIAMKAVHLSHAHASTKLIQKLLDKAISIDPDSHAIKSIIEDNTYQLYIDQMHKAFGKSNVHQAANIVQRSQNTRIKDYFFKVIDQWIGEIREFDKGARFLELKDFYRYCRQIDKAHPVTLKISEEIKRYEK